MIDDGLIEMALHATVGHSDRPNPYRLASWLTEMQLLPLFAAPFAMDDIRTYLGSHERTEQQTTIQQWRAEDQRVLLARVGKKGQKHMATKAPTASVSNKPATHPNFHTR